MSTLFTKSFDHIIEKINRDVNPDKFIEIVSTKMTIDQFVWASETLKMYDAPQIIQLDVMREKYVNILCELVTEFCAPFCEASYSGTRSIISDFDVSVKNIHGRDMILYVERLTQTLFKCEKKKQHHVLPDLFDLNFYTSVWYTVCNNKLVLFEDCKTPKALSSKIKIRQVAWALLKFCFQLKNFGNKTVVKDLEIRFLKPETVLHKHFNTILSDINTNIISLDDKGMLIVKSKLICDAIIGVTNFSL